MVELHKLDCDVLVGHNISGFDLDLLLHRAQVCLMLLFLFLTDIVFHFKTFRCIQDFATNAIIHSF